MLRKPTDAFDLKAARKMRGLSQTQVAEILCTTQPSIARWEIAGNMPAIYRKAWLLHWRIQDDPGTNAGVARVERRGNKARTSAKEFKRSARMVREKAQSGSALVPVYSEPVAVESDENG